MTSATVARQETASVDQVEVGDGEYQEHDRGEVKSTVRRLMTSARSEPMIMNASMNTAAIKPILSGIGSGEADGLHVARAEHEVEEERAAEHRIHQRGAKDCQRHVAPNLPRGVL